MRSFTVALVAGAGVLLASSAFAGPMTNGIFGVNSGAGTEQVRMVCDEIRPMFRKARIETGHRPRLVRLRAATEDTSSSGAPLQ